MCFGSPAKIDNIFFFIAPTQGGNQNDEDIGYNYGNVKGLLLFEFPSLLLPSKRPPGNHNKCISQCMGNFLEGW